MKFDPTSGMPVFSLSVHPSQPVQEGLFSIGDFLVARKKTIVIAIDEFQQISRYKENAEAVFRQFMQAFPGIRFIYSGSHRQLMHSMYMESNRPFYKSCQLMGLSPIALEKYIPFIQHHFSDSNKKIPADLIASIYAWGRGQTYTIQLICNRLYGSNIPLNDTGLAQVQADILEQESTFFGNYFNLLTTTQWNILLAIAKEESVKNPLAKDFLQQYHLGAASTVSSALKSLVEKELVVREGQAYFIHDVIFSRWLDNPIPR